MIWCLIDVLEFSHNFGPHTFLSSYIIKLSDGIVSKREDLQVLKSSQVFDHRNAIVKQTQILKIHKSVQTFNNLDIIERQIWVTE